MYEIVKIEVKGNVFFDVRSVQSSKRVARFKDEVLANNFSNYLIRNMITTGEQWLKQPARIRNFFTMAATEAYPSFS